MNLGTQVSSERYDKAYSEIGSTLRGAETTINAVRDLRAFRPKEGGAEEDLQWRPLRQGIAVPQCRKKPTIAC